MTSESLNERLLDFYHGIAAQLQQILEPYKDCSSPRFIFVPEGYTTADTRLMIVGQQTNGWDCGTLSRSVSSVQLLMQS